MVINNFLNRSWLDFVRGEIRNQKGSLSRHGYDNKPTMRDDLDPRNAETKYITDPRNVLCRVWDKFLWNSPIEEEMKDNADSAFVHATYTHFGRTLLSSYGNGDSYGYHVDIDLDCIITCVLFITLGEQRFSGGDFFLGSNLIPFENNKLIMFPSCKMHAVTPVNLDKDEFENRRFTLQYFISSVTNRTRYPDESRNLE